MKYCKTCERDYCRRCFGPYVNVCDRCYEPNPVKILTSASQVATVSASGLSLDLKSAMKGGEIEKIVMERATKQDGSLWEMLEINFRNGSGSREEWRRITNG